MLPPFFLSVENTGVGSLNGFENRGDRKVRSSMLLFSAKACGVCRGWLPKRFAKPWWLKGQWFDAITFRQWKVNWSGRQHRLEIGWDR